MNETIRRYWERISQYWNQFKKSQKIMIISIAVITLITIAVLSYSFSKTEYSLAYTNLNPSDAAAIKEYLNNAGIDYKFSTDGTAIGVPTKEVTEVKIDIESQNLLNSGSIGYGIFRENISDFGMSENQFNVLNVDAKAGEIEQTLNAMNGVSNSKVLLNIPEESVFINADGPEQASASVVIAFNPGYRVDQSKIDTIYNLVSKSVSNLPLENITISNQDNEMLPSSKLSGGIGNSANIASEQFLIKKQYELDIQKNVQSFLGKIMGSDKVVVHVVSTLNFDQKNTQETLFTPVNTEDNTGIERSVQEIQKSYTSEGGNAEGGVPGTGEPDVPGYPGGTTTGNSSSEEVETIVNYEINEINKSIVSSPFVVEDLTIFAGIEPFIPDDPESLTEETKNEIQGMLASIIGTSLANSGKTYTAEELNNKVSVITQTFQGKSTLSDSGTSSLLFYSIGAIALALVAAGGYFVFRRKKPQIIEEDLAVNTPDALPSIDFDSVPQDNQVRKQLESLAKKKPDEFVDLLRTWLVDE